MLVLAELDQPPVGLDHGPGQLRLVTVNVGQLDVEPPTVDAQALDEGQGLQRVGERRTLAGQLDDHLPLEQPPQRFRLVDGHQTGVEQGDAVAEALGLVQVVGAEQNRAPLAAQPLDQPPHVAGRLRVQGRRGLVEEQQLRLGQQRPRQGQALLHPLAQPPDLVPGALVQLQQFQIAINLLPRIQRLVEPGEVEQVVAGAHPGVEARRLGQQADALVQALGLPGRIQAQHRSFAVGGGDHPGQHPHRGGLAGAVGSEQAQDLAGTDLEVQAVDGQGLFEMLGQAVGGDGGHGSPRWVFEQVLE